jgi:hypothetical protein
MTSGNERVLEVRGFESSCGHPVAIGVTKMTEFGEFPGGKPGSLEGENQTLELVV